MRHALPNALAPIISVVALNLAYLIVGVVVVETVFVYPGLGQLMVDEVSKHDVPVVQACGLIFAATFILLNMIADILAIFSNPRLRPSALTRWRPSRGGDATFRPPALRHRTIGLVNHRVNLFIALVRAADRALRSGRRVGDAWADPDAEHWLGLDNLGRDLFSRLIYGARMSIGLSLSSRRFSFLIGIVTGFAAAVLAVDRPALSRLVDLLLSMPTLIFAFIILSVLGTELAGADRHHRDPRLDQGVPPGARGRGELVSLEFVEAARAARRGLVVDHHAAKSCPTPMPPLVAEFGLRFCFTFLFIAALSFLGLGVQPPDADWGSMVKDYRDMINFGSAAPLYPAGAIAILTIGVNFVVDWMLSIHSRGQGEGA